MAGQAGDTGTRHDNARVSTILVATVRAVTAEAVTEKVLGGRGAADVPGAHEQDPQGRGGLRGGGRLPVG